MKFGISTQVFTEVSNVLFKKFSLGWDTIQLVLEELKLNCNVYINGYLVIYGACDIAQKYYDSLIISSALTSNCQYLFTEDLHHSQIIEQQLEIINPFQV